MKTPGCDIVLWTGPKHSGKSTAATQLVAKLQTHDKRVGGFLAPSRYEHGALVGFDLESIESRERWLLAQRSREGSMVGRFAFQTQTLERGQALIEKAVQADYDLVVVDEFGPMELDGGGWRSAIDRIIPSYQGILLLVVRAPLVTRVQTLYRPQWLVTIEADEEDACERVLSYLT